MPTQEGVGGNEKALPMCARETSAKGSEDGPIGGPVLDTFVKRTFEDLHLVPSTMISMSLADSDRRDEMMSPRSRQIPR
jgi:hypothetical protein